jgi:nicotinate-nucleotide pyrophosphorylase
MSDIAAGAGQQTWSLDDNDRALLRRLITDLRRLLSLAKANSEIMAVGEAVDAVEKVRDGEGLQAVLTLSVGVQDGNETFNEAWFVRLGLRPDAIVLDKLSTTYMAETGHDRHTTSYAVLKPSGGFDEAGITAWLAELNELRRWSTAEIHSESTPR